jgi:hypothetical protein
LVQFRRRRPIPRHPKKSRIRGFRVVQSRERPRCPQK